MTFFSIVLQGLFAFFEMASVSFNKVRLQYYVSLGNRRALWLNYLLKRPSRLFGTTLIGITASLVVGSECSRRFYEAIHLDPDLAPLTQVPLVLLFGELAPMFAARRHPEQAAMLCVPFMIFFAKLLSPLIWTFDALSRLIHRLMGKGQEGSLFLTREEVRMAFEEQEEGEDEFNSAISHIFQLKNFNAGQLMIPLSKVQMAPSNATLAEVRHLLSVHYAPMIPIYHRSTQNIVAIAPLRSLLRLSDQKKVIDAASSPWFVTRDTSILQLLHQFRRNNQNVAVILDPNGQAVGILTLDQILAEIFGEESHAGAAETPTPYIERTLLGEMTIFAFNQEFEADLPLNRGETLSDLILAELGHLPVIDESIHIGDFEFTVIEPTLLGIKSLRVRSS